MAQRDYVSRGRSGAQRKKTSNRRRGGSSRTSKTMVALAVAVLVTFAGGLYFISHNKPGDNTVIPRTGPQGNGLPPKPEERWRYIKELENRQIGVASPTEPSAGGEIRSTSQLTDEQRQLLEQMQSDMRRQPTPLNEVPYNDQSQAIRTQNSLKPQTVVPVIPGSNSATSAIAPRPLAPATSSHQPTTTNSTAVKPTPSTQKPALAETKKETAKTDKQDTAQKETAKNEPKQQESKPEKEQRWMVQCGSFKTVEPAESIRAELAFAGMESRIASSGGWHRIILGPYTSRTAADKAAQKLKGMGQSNCIPLAAGG
ncbi:cell division protein FtsN [Musicola paradisiaca]|nr:cell division protein FtsN [Musicola paradisiaca]